MNAKDLFPTIEEREEVKSWLSFWSGEVTKVWDFEGKILFESHKSFDNNKNRGIIYSKQYEQYKRRQA